MRINKLKGSFLLLVTLMIVVVKGAFAADFDPVVEIDPNNAVTFSGIVDANSYETVFTATVGQTQVTPENLANAIRPGSGQVLRITSVHGYVFGSPIPPAETDYALAFVGACTPRLSIRAFGNGAIAYNGRSTVQVNYRPGLVASLQSNEVLCLRSNTQSNQRVFIEVHGYLQALPAKH